jgi:hypothetical protein
MKTPLVFAMCTMLSMPIGVQLFAQDQAAPPPAAAQQAFPPEQLDSLVAPIALYPDSLLSQVLVASTYPLELVEANQWLQQNGNLQGQALIAAAQQQNWDPSIQALVPFPDVIRRLNSDVRWTTDLGNAFLAQQGDVMAAVQRMRQRAQANGRLTDTPQQRVITDYQGDQSAIEIQPTDPQVVYVPTYNPDYFWGSLYPWPALYYPSIGFGWGWGYGIHLGLFFGGWGGWGGWGWGPGWFNHSVFVNNSFFNRYNFHGYGYGGSRGTALWAHDSAHRMGVPYANRGVAQRFAGNNFRATSQGFRPNTAPHYNGGNAYGGSTAQRYNGATNNFRGTQGAPAQHFNGSNSYANSYGRNSYAARPSQSYTPQSRSYAPQSNSFRGTQGGSYSHSVAPSHSSAPAFHGGGGGGGHGGGGRR